MSTKAIKTMEQEEEEEVGKPAVLKESFSKRKPAGKLARGTEKIIWIGERVEGGCQ